ncbi:LysM peptidoglycan-binding domain-containing protein [Larkinella sp. VNQ87]|uniref:LysM peptidoglycan-binding domain-containing protein n=1 Tax=Larkinella sp. VNQ87 TaxID=3400921 RepID=UPI003C0502A0
METENAKRNPRPAEGSSLPTITLAVLILTILALLYVGYEYVADDTRGSDELTNVALDTTVQKPAELPIEPELVAPIEIDTSSRNAPVDLSQATPPPAEEEKKEEAKQPALDSEERPVAEKPSEKPVAEKTTPVAKPVEEKPKEEKKETPKVNIPAGGVSVTHTVKPGETIYSVATKYNLSVNTLKAMNPDLKDNEVKADVTKLKVKARAYHTVGPGDILRVVAEKYGVTVDALMKANGKTKNYAARGEKLIIPYAEKQ